MGQWYRATFKRYNRERKGNLTLENLPASRHYEPRSFTVPKSDDGPGSQAGCEQGASESLVNAPEARLKRHRHSEGNIDRSTKYVNFNATEAVVMKFEQNQGSMAASPEGAPDGRLWKPSIGMES